MSPQCESAATWDSFGHNKCILSTFCPFYGTYQSLLSVGNNIISAVPYWTFMMTSYFQTRIRGITERPRHMIDCEEYVTEFKSCDYNPSTIQLDAEYCETVDHTGRPIGEYGKIYLSQTL